MSIQSLHSSPRMRVIRLLRRIGNWLLKKADQLGGDVCSCGHVETDHIAVNYGCRFAGTKTCQCEIYTAKQAEAA